MRWVYFAIVVVFVAVVLVFVLQNTDIVSMSFLGLALSAPLALIVLVAYVLGAATGGSLYAVLRRSIQGSRRAAR
jgi:lipopolysaccharide assembly protein A